MVIGLVQVEQHDFSRLLRHDFQPIFFADRCAVTRFEGMTIEADLATQHLQPRMSAWRQFVGNVPSHVETGKVDASILMDT